MPSNRTKKPSVVQPQDPTLDLRSSELAPISKAAMVAEKERLPRLTLKNFVREAWSILEPVSTLQWNWHLDLICDYLTLVRDNKFKAKCGQHLEGLIFNVPPRTMKSLLITVFFPIWLWTTDPARRFMFVSYSEKLSTQHSVFRRRVIES